MNSWTRGRPWFGVEAGGLDAAVLRVRGRWVGGVLLAALMLPMGCGEVETQKAIGEFRRASGVLAATYEQFVVAGNEVEEADYLAGLETVPGVYREREVRSDFVFAPEQIALRAAAIKALGAYTATLAELASGKAAAGLATDAQSASAQVGTLQKDLVAAVAQHTGAKPELFEGPVTTAITAAGAILKLMEARRAQAEIRTSVMDNDKAVSALFMQIADEASGLYERQRATVGAERVAVVNAFNDEAQGRGATGRPDKAKMIYLAEKLKRVDRAIALQRAADPRAAIAAFQAAHTALIAAVSGKKGDRKTLGELIAEAKRFADEVGPVASDVQAFAASF